MTGEQTIASFVASLAERVPTPGGGAAAAVTAAIGCATAAMACRYTTGEKWPEVTAEAEALAQQLDLWREHALLFADADATAFAAVGVAKKTKDATVLQAAEAAAAAVPAGLIALCGEAAQACAGFRPRCNPWLVSDIDTALHLLAGAGRAARRTLLINRPSAAMGDLATATVARLATLEPS
jgi:formiminotetrahydrofolate cyclodeaminase